MNTYSKLNDIESKLVYTELFNFFMWNDFVDFTRHPFEEHFFDYSIYKRLDDEVFVDCGAYNGDTLDIFLSNNADFEKYIAIEADKTNYNNLLKKSDRINSEKEDKKIITYNEYISDSKQKIGFDSTGTSYSSAEGETTIYTTTLDDLAYQFKPTFIKINVEGADLDAICGARNIISDYHPIIAAQGHHRASHLWEIINIIDEYGDGYYSFFLRNYRGITEYTFYAIPNNRKTV